MRAMKACVNIGANIEYRPSAAVLVYGDGGDGAFASLHQAKQAENRIPYLTPGEALGIPGRAPPMPDLWVIERQTVRLRPFRSCAYKAAGLVESATAIFYQT